MLDELTVKKIETPTATFLIKDGILISTYKPGADVKLADVKINCDLRKELQQGEKMLVLADIKDAWQFSERAREFVASEAVSKLSIAMAIITGYSMPIRIVANFFMRFNKPVTPTKLFKKEVNALKWLSSFKEIKEN